MSSDEVLNTLDVDVVVVVVVVYTGGFGRYGFSVELLKTLEGEVAVVVAV